MTEQSDIKLCPYCAEEIKAAAIVCKHCGRTLDGAKDVEQPQAAPKKSSPLARLVMLFLLLLAGFTVFSGLFGMFTSENEQSRPPTRQAPPTSSTIGVTYRVTVSRITQVDLTYENAGGNTEQASGITIRRGEVWSERLTVGRGDFVYLSAQQGDSTGTVTCEILVAGQVVETASSSGPYTIATCSGSAE